MEVVGEISNDDELLQLLSQEQPDIVLIDLHVSSSVFGALMRKVMKNNPQIGFIVLSQHQESYFL